MPGSLDHLFKRFFDVLLARPLMPSEFRAVNVWLTPEEALAFFAQPTPDQRHAYHAALSVVTAEERDTRVIKAALLHDVGKRHARLGVIGRSVASVLMLLGTPLSERMIAYRDHGPVGAEELEALRCETLVVEFARNHHGSRPTTIPAATWRLLQSADQPPNARTLVYR